MIISCSSAHGRAWRCESWILIKVEKFFSATCNLAEFFLYRILERQAQPGPLYEYDVNLESDILLHMAMPQQL